MKLFTAFILSLALSAGFACKKKDEGATEDTTEEAAKPAEGTDTAAEPAADEPAADEPAAGEEAAAGDEAAADGEEAAGDEGGEEEATE